MIPDRIKCSVTVTKRTWFKSYSAPGSTVTLSLPYPLSAAVSTAATAHDATTTTTHDAAARRLRAPATADAAGIL